MPQLKKTQVKKVTLPSFEAGDAWVEIEAPARMPDFENMEASDSKIRQTASIIALKIKAWNLTDENDVDLPINTDSVLMLSPVDFAELSMALELNKMGEFSSAKKNN